MRSTMQAMGVALVATLALPAGLMAGQADSTPAKRGAYLSRIGGCNDCHTPFKMGPKGPEPDMSLMLSGHPAAVAVAPAPKLAGSWMWAGSATNTAFAGPWGVSYAINLTPDATGLGNWTEQMFVSAMRSGKHAGVGRPILPPMPWQGVGALTDDDLKALFAYLRSVKPVKNVVPAALVAPMPGAPTGSR